MTTMFGICVAMLTLAGADTGLTIAHGASGKPYLLYAGAPLFAFGPGDESRLTGGAADLERWATWQRSHGMNLLRTYPASVPLAVHGTPGPEPFLRVGDHWDVEAFNEDYFTQFRDRIAALEEAGIIVHLQLWQIVYFKGGETRWDANYLNPRNNMTAWTKELGRGRDYIDAPAGSPARAHQKAWVFRILDAIKGRKNVWIDVINELGNEMGTLEWAVEVVGWIRAWEAQHGQRMLVGVDSEHHYHEETFAPYAKHFDLIIINELQNPERARRIFDTFQKPMVSVRSSDGRNQPTDYVFANPSQVGEEHQTRYRTLCYRSLFSNVQSVGAYWKMPVETADYRDMQSWARSAEVLRKFWGYIAVEWPQLVVDDSSVRSEAITPFAYGMRSEGMRLVYLECGPKAWNTAYPASILIVECPEGLSRARVLHPGSGEELSPKTVRMGGTIQVELPAFTDDLILILDNFSG